MGVRLVDNSPRVIAAIKQQVADGLNAAAELWVSEAQNNANVDTGFMKTHIGVTVPATANSLFAEIRSLARYSWYQDQGIRGNLFWTRAWAVVRSRFKAFLIQGSRGTAGAGVIRAAEEEFHGVFGRKGAGF